MATMADLSIATEGRHTIDLDSSMRYLYDPWMMPIEPLSTHPVDQSMTVDQQPASSLQLPFHAPAYRQITEHDTQSLMPEWPTPSPTATQLDYAIEAAYVNGYMMPYETSPTDLVSPQSRLNPNMHLDTPYRAMLEQLNGMTAWQDSPTNLMGFSQVNGLPDSRLAQQDLNDSFQMDACLESPSLVEVGGDWLSVHNTRHDPQMAISNPGQVLHCRTFSESSISESRLSCSSYADISNAISSPETDSITDCDYYHVHGQQHEPIRCYEDDKEPSHSPVVASTALVEPIDIKPSSFHRSPFSIGKNSPSGRRQRGKNLSSRSSKPSPPRPSHVPRAEQERRIGRRKGPLTSEQRRQACEIRKLGACLRCKFLKKTCDKGEPCGGCRPSHARLWQVPCTRIDIRDLGFFMKDWMADFATLPMNPVLPSGNIRGFSASERTLYITHGYGYVLPVQAHEVFVDDDSGFGLDWVETANTLPLSYSVNTAKLTAGLEGIDSRLLSNYIDQHIDKGFEGFVDDYFDGTPFLTEMLKTAYRFWLREKTPVIRKSLKLLLAYNLTQHVTMVEGVPDEEKFVGRITDRSSKFFGKTVAPFMINIQIKHALASMWRELHKDILAELSRLYSSIYTKDKLKHWPTIFMVASILLGVWEEIQFDCCYKTNDPMAASQFCAVQEGVPVGVIVGLFATISQKLPALAEWDTAQHHTRLNSNPAVCDALTEVRKHVVQYDQYLRSRASATFDRDDFDCLSNKFVSKLVIRAN